MSQIQLPIYNMFVEEGKAPIELDNTFNVVDYIKTFNPGLVKDGFKLEVIDDTGLLSIFYPINGEPSHSITFYNFKDLNKTLSRIPSDKLPIVVSHMYVVFKAKDVYRHKSGAVHCRKATLYGMNPEGKGLIELGHSCFGSLIQKE